MSYDDPGDDEREAALFRQECEKWTWQAIMSVCLAVGGPLAVLIAVVVWHSTRG